VALLASVYLKCILNFRIDSFENFHVPNPAFVPISFFAASGSSAQDVIVTSRRYNFAVLLL